MRPFFFLLDPISATNLLDYALLKMRNDCGGLCAVNSTTFLPGEVFHDHQDPPEDPDPPSSSGATNFRPAAPFRTRHGLFFNETFGSFDCPSLVRNEFIDLLGPWEYIEFGVPQFIPDRAIWRDGFSLGGKIPIERHAVEKEANEEDGERSYAAAVASSPVLGDPDGNHRRLQRRELLDVPSPPPPRAPPQRPAALENSLLCCNKILLPGSGSRSQGGGRWGYIEERGCFLTQDGHIARSEV